MDYFSLGILARELDGWRVVVRKLLTGTPPSSMMEQRQMEFLVQVIETKPPEVVFVPKGWLVKGANDMEQDSRDSYYEMEKERYAGLSPDGDMGFADDQPDRVYSPTEVIWMNLRELFGGKDG